MRLYDTTNKSIECMLVKYYFIRISTLRIDIIVNFKQSFVNLISISDSF